MSKLNETEAAKFKDQFESQLHYLKLEKLLKHNKHAREIVNSKPWSGSESVKDSSLRMLVDSAPKPKPSIAHKTPKRILTAREMSSEYKETKTIERDDNFREMYKERLLGPSMLLNTNNPLTTLNLANTMASAKINAKIDLKTGKFNDENMDKVRGKPLKREHLANATDTSYFINEMLNKQEVLPPWVENQQNLNSDIRKFQQNLDRLLINYCKFNGIPSRGKLLDEFESKQLNYVIEKVKLLNKSVRDYNLQAPSSNFHKLKLDPGAELRGSLDRVYDDLPELVKQDNIVYSSTKQGFLSLFDEQKVVNQRPVPKLNVWNSFKDMFKEL